MSFVAVVPHVVTQFTVLLGIVSVILVDYKLSRSPYFIVCSSDTNVMEPPKSVQPMNSLLKFSKVVRTVLATTYQGWEPHSWSACARIMFLFSGPGLSKHNGTPVIVAWDLRKRWIVGFSI